MYGVDSSNEVLANPLRGRIYRWHAMVTFPAVTISLLLVGVLTVIANHEGIWTSAGVIAILVSVAVSLALTSMLTYSNIIHAPRTVALEGSVVAYDAMRWALVLPKRLRLAMPIERIDHTGVARWGGAVAVFGTAEIRDDPTLSGRPFRDDLFLAPEVLQRLGLRPARRYREGRDSGPWSPV